MNTALMVVGLISVVGIVSAIGGRWRLPSPLLLVLVGVGGSYLPFVPKVELEPELVLIGLLPPLLYAASIRTSLIDFRSNRRPIAFLSVGLVVVTAVAVAVVATWLLGVSFPVGLALGAVVAPPDAVAATAVARRIGMPRRIITILEGESLVNDATALALLRTALAAVAGGITVWGAAGGFLLAAGGGVVIGLIVATVIGTIRTRIAEPVLDTTISFVTPFIAYILAESIHASGVLAVVITGLLLGHRAPVIQSAASRISERTNWRTVQFILENLVFLLIGLQARSIIQEVGASELSPSRIAVFCLAVLATVTLIRPLWVFPATYVPRPIASIRGTAPPWTAPAVISWAGMRGVITLATVFALPGDIPFREVLVASALAVTAGTLMLQGFTLPTLVKALGLRGPDPAEDRLQEASVLHQAAEAGLGQLEQLTTTNDPPEVLEVLRDRANQRTQAAWERLGRSETETPSAAYIRLRRQMLTAERRRVLDLRAKGTLAHEVLRNVLEALDIEESVLEGSVDLIEGEREVELIAPSSQHSGCEHIFNAPRTAVPKSPGGCATCLEEGTRWVHLRLCLTCGEVACCDSSPRRHASAHSLGSGHPVVRSFEPGEAWRWCYIDSLLG
ncbi:MAG: Na+/H+ antiporter [Actinomycetota bacterium]